MAKSSNDVRSAFPENWQAGKDFPESNLYMLDNRICCDVSFLVGEKRELVETHKFILVSRSCVFEAMLNGPMAQTGEIEIPDVEPGIFKAFVRFLYTNDVIVDPENVTVFLYLAKKYNICRVEALCVGYLESSLSASNACTILEQAHRYDEKDLYDKALDFIKIKGTEVIQSDAFIELCGECVEKVIRSDDFVVEEEKLFTAMLSWAEGECKRQGRKATPEAERNVLGKMLYHIRFPVMDHAFFVHTVGRRGILTLEERIQILEYFTCPETGAVAFEPQRRKRLTKTKTCVRFPEFSEQWSCPVAPNAKDAIQFTCDKDINLHGFQLYGSKDNKHYSEYRVSASVYDERNNIVMSDSSLTLKDGEGGDEKSFLTLFEKPLSIAKGRKYSLVVGIQGPTSYKGVNGCDCVADSKVTFEFSDSDMSTNYTKTNIGQIPGLIYTVIN